MLSVVIKLFFLIEASKNIVKHDHRNAVDSEII